MVDKEKIRQKVQYIEENNRKLEKLQVLSLNEFLQDFRNIEATKHLLQVNIEAMIDIANHIIARNRWSTPATSAEAFKILNKKDLINDAQIDTFVRMVKFRNRVVHLYYQVDDEEIYHLLQDNIDDFSKYVATIANKIF